MNLELHFFITGQVVLTIVGEHLRDSRYITEKTFGIFNPSTADIITLPASSLRLRVLI